MSHLDTILKEEISEFRKIGHQFYNKELSVSEFKVKSGAMGVYAQRGGEKFMIRLRIPSGILAMDKLKVILDYMQQYHLEHIHLTTRQMIQLHDLSIDQVCDIMEDAIDKGIYTRGAGGNFPRNVALSPLSGVDAQEAFDVTPYALLVNDYFMTNILSYKLPRKLKIAFSNNDNDTANTIATDLGFLAVKQNGKAYFKLYIAGGLGKNPAKGVEYDTLVEPNEVLYHVEALTRLFMAEGDYENKSKARTRYIVTRIGEQAFLTCYKKHLKQVKQDYVLNSIETLIDDTPLLQTHCEIIEDHCLIKQKQQGLYTVIIHPIYGQLYRSDLTNIVSLLEPLEAVDIRLSMTESMYVRNLTETQAKNLLDITSAIRQKTNIEQSVSCIGVPTCQIGIEQSQKMLKAILDYLNTNGLTEDLLPSIHISGCSNSCSRHQLAQIGLAGKKKKVNDTIEDVFEISIGGESGKDNTVFGRVYGDMLTNDIPVFLYEVASELKKQKTDFRNYIKTNPVAFEKIIQNYLI